MLCTYRILWAHLFNTTCCPTLTLRNSPQVCVLAGISPGQQLQYIKMWIDWYIYTRSRKWYMIITIGTICIFGAKKTCWKVFSISEDSQILCCQVTFEFVHGIRRKLLCKKKGVTNEESLIYALWMAVFMMCISRLGG